MVSLRIAVLAQAALLWAAQQGFAQEAAQAGQTAKDAASAPSAGAKSTPKSAPADPQDEGLWVGLSYWYAPTHPHMRNGHAAIVKASPATLDYPGTNQPAPGVTIGIPAGRYNTLRVSYFQTRSSWASTTSAPAVLLFGSDYKAGDALSVKYKLQNIKVSWDYLTWPFPYEGSTLRIKTLYQFQYTTMHTYVNGPQTTDTAGNVYQTTSDGSHKLALPALGVGIEKIFSKSVRWEAQASGFTIPHHAATYDIDTYVAVKRGKLEIDLGGRMFYLKTSPKKNDWVRANMPGAYVGVRWYL